MLDTSRRVSTGWKAIKRKTTCDLAQHIEDQSLSDQLVAGMPSETKFSIVKTRSHFPPYQQSGAERTKKLRNIGIFDMAFALSH